MDSDLNDLLELLEREISAGRVDLPQLEDAVEEGLSKERARALGHLTGKRAEQIMQLAAGLKANGADADAIAAAAELHASYDQLTRELLAI